MSPEISDLSSVRGCAYADALFLAPRFEEQSQVQRAMGLQCYERHLVNGIDHPEYAFQGHRIHSLVGRMAGRILHSTAPLE